MGNLFISFCIAIGGAAGLVALSRVFDLEAYSNRIVPLIPILYAIVYEVLERRKTGRAKTGQADPTGEKTLAGAQAPVRNLTAGRIVGDVGVSFAIKFSLELLLAAGFLYTVGRSFESVYGPFGIETIGAFLRGEHPWVSGAEGLTVLALISLLTSLGTGVWIGYTSPGNAILEGVVAGAVVTLINSMTSMLILYRSVEAMAVQLADRMGYILSAGFLVVIAVQVLLYGLWSGIARQARDEREALLAVRKQAKKLKKK